MFAAIRLLLAIGLLAAAPAHAQTFPERGRAAVVDAAGIIPDKQEQALAELLTEWQRETGHQLVVATVPDLQGRPISDYANGLFRHWRLGRAGVNDGVLLLHAPRERRIRIEVGYGLEPVLTDSLTSRIIRESILPNLAEDPGAALGEGAMRIMAAASAPVPGRTAAPARLAAPPAADEGPSTFTILLFSLTPAIIVVAILVWAFRRGRQPPSRRQGRGRGKRKRRRRAGGAVKGVTLDYGNTYAGPSYSGWGASSSSWDSSSSSSSWDSGSSSSSWDSGSSYSSDSGGFDSGGGSSGGGGSDSSY